MACRYGPIRATASRSISSSSPAPAVEPLLPPALLYHGTAERNLASIRKEGLEKRQRHHVHLSAESDTARAVGARYGKPVVLSVDAAGMAAEGFVLFSLRQRGVAD